MCSLCKRIKAYETRWLELEEAIETLNLFDTAELPELVYGICDGCACLGRHTNREAPACA